MVDFLVDGYLWLKAFHIVSVIAWMAGMLYLPRLYVYHCAAEPGSVQSETFKVMERRLLRAIVNPAMSAAFLFGILMIVANSALLATGWFLVKLAIVVLGLGGFHGLLSRWRRDFAADRNRHSARFYRIANEAPTLALVVVVVLAVVKPF